LCVELVDPRPALVKRLADLGDLISEADKGYIRTTLKTMPTAELVSFVERWEAKAAKSAGAGVPDEQIPH
jgi:hypothetical protein